MLVSHLEHIADEWKNVNILLQIETNFITYVTCIHAEGAAHLGIIRVYIVFTDPADVQADLGVHCSHMSWSQFLFGAPKNDYGVSLQADEHKSTCMYKCTTCTLVVLGFNDTSTLVGYFVSSSWEREKRDTRKEILEKMKGGGGGGGGGDGVGQWQKLQDTFASPNHPHQYMYSRVA